MHWIDGLDRDPADVDGEGKRFVLGGIRVELGAGGEARVATTRFAHPIATATSEVTTASVTPNRRVRMRRNLHRQTTADKKTRPMSPR